MIHGTKKAIYPIDSNSSIVKIKKYRNGKAEKTMTHYRIKVHVKNAQEELSEFIRFTEELQRCRQSKTLTFDREDKNATRPAFIIDYPQDMTDGSYFIIKCYTVFDIN